MKPFKISDLGQRLPQAGRIRTGRKVTARNGKVVPEKLRTFRFTSSDAASLDTVADLYGGEPRAWTDRASPDRYELLTEASEIRVALPPDPLGGTPIFEHWEGGGNKRRCDGEVCMVPSGGGPDGGDPLEVNCLCAREGKLTCKVTTRLSVILPDVRFLGIWRLDTKGRNAAVELPGMVEGVQSVQASQGITPAVLRLEERITWSEGKKQEYVVPVLGVDASPMELAAGSVRLGIEGGAAALDPPPVEVLKPEIMALPETPSTPVPADPELVRQWADSLTSTHRNRTLNRAREISAERGLTVPLSIDDVDIEVLDEVMGEVLWTKR